MPVTRDIVETYKRPRTVVRRLLEAGPREDRALAIMMAFCVVLFVSRWPALSRQAHLTGQELDMLLGSSLLGLVFILPLILYVLALASGLVVRLLGGRASGYGLRISLFWALLASVPVLLLYGLTDGFIGASPALNAVGLVWLVAFGWFWISGLRVAGFEGRS